MTEEELINNAKFKEIAVQGVGKTGYTALYEIIDNSAVTWAHVNDNLIGKDLIKVTEKALGDQHPRFKRIVEASVNGKEGRGYYLWQDANGAYREKFMVVTFVPNTNYCIASTTYMDEFTSPINLLLSRINNYKNRAVLINTAGMAILLILLAVLVLAYGRNLTNRIAHLSDVVERISLGELGIEIKAKAKDEIGQLSEAISRMQDSLRLSIERLRKRRKAMH